MSTRFPLSSIIANTALPMTSWRQISIFLVIFMAFIAVGFVSRIWTHCEPCPENFAFRIKQFLKSIGRFCSFQNGVSFESAQFRQNRRFILNAFNGNYSHVAPIESLILPRTPSAIFGRIVSIIVRSVNRESLRTLAHVFDESGETVAPSLAYRDASSAVIFERLIFGIKAALFHVDPYCVSKMSCARFVHSSILAIDIKNVKECSNAV